MGGRHRKHDRIITDTNNTNHTIKESIWDKKQVLTVLNEYHALNLWHYLIKHQHITAMCDIPFDTLQTPRKAVPTLVDKFVVYTTKVITNVESSRGDTNKLLVELQDGHHVETVVMKHKGRSTVCLSSQIGCAMGCKFCATGTMGIIGDLTCGEIVEQFLHANKVSKIRNIVYMGEGEPLNNYDNVLASLQFFIDTKRFNLSARHVTVSTVGVLDSMYRLSCDASSVNLALSLHAPNQEVRLKIVPTANANKIDRLMAAVDNHTHAQQVGKTSCTIDSNSSDVPHDIDDGSSVTTSILKNRERSSVMIEYILIQDINNLPEHAHELGILMQPRKNHILLNLIPYNPTDVCESYKPPTKESIKAFMDICISHGIHTRVRQEMGQDINGACGQLALVYQKKEGAGIDIEDTVTDIINNSPSMKKIKHKNKKNDSASVTPSSSDSSGSSSQSCNGNDDGLWKYDYAMYAVVLTTIATIIYIKSRK